MNASDHRRTVLISGVPGAGKTTLARERAQRLRWPLIAKDDLKEEASCAYRDSDSGDALWDRVEADLRKTLKL